MIENRKEQLEKLKRAERKKTIALKNKRILGAFKSLMASSLSSILLQLASIPILLHFWGSEKFGEWIILSSIPAYIAMSDMGLITVANNKIDASCTKYKYLSAARIYHSSLLLLGALISAVFLIIMILYYIFGSWFTGLFNIINEQTVIIVTLILFTDSALSLWHNHHSALFRTIHRYDLSIDWQTYGRVLSLIALLVSVSLGADITVGAINMLLTRLFIFLLLFISLKKNLLWLRTPKYYLSKKELHNLFHSTNSFVLLPVSNALYLHASIIIIAAATNPSVVAVFSTIRTFTRLIPQFVSIIGKSYWSEITKEYSYKNTLELSYMFKKIFFLSITTATIASIFYLLFGQFFYELWTNKQLDFNYLLLSAFVLNGALIAIYTSLEVFLLSTNNHKIYAIIFFTGTALQLILSSILISYYSEIIIPLLSSIFSLAIIIYLTFVIRKNIEQNGDVK
jgi:O-antigen/teichoic acid export membrane protein